MAGMVAANGPPTFGARASGAVPLAWQVAVPKQGAGSACAAFLAQRAQTWPADERGLDHGRAHRSPAGRAGWATQAGRVLPCGLPGFFAAADCTKCPARACCTRAKTAPRSLTLQPHAVHEAIQAVRQRQQTAIFQEDYAHRAGIEGTVSQGVRAFGLRQAR